MRHTKQQKETIREALSGATRVYLAIRDTKTKQKFMKCYADALFVGRGFANSIVDRASPSHDVADTIFDVIYGRKESLP